VLISTSEQCAHPTDVCSRTYLAYEEIMEQMAEAWPDGNFSQTVAPHELYTLGDLGAIREVVERLLARD
jgi:hypothetical protein